ncbi:hypothetical protein SAMN02745244_02568 [Tessaracoccus bendigoensis DSM 12906]|uniref:Lipoprotein n=1 Tax=Tessaracoccus bendigoensis DSM 12906 TaxID=1123357 RepID=A0A1M6JHV8_9ACTN|nr:hypothetical protein SAMN02745244_02568 [Tessaracoccus bendigoensis DSM 12906]
MSYWATRTRHTTLATLAGAVVIVGLVSGCGAPARDLNEVRQDALVEMEQLRFAEDYHDSLKTIERSVNIDEIDNVLRIARDTDAENQDVFWGCAQRGTGLLDGATLSAMTDGVKEFNEFELTLGRNQSASLDLVGTAEMIGQMEISQGDQWLIDHAGTVTGWEATLDESIANRRIELHEGRQMVYVYGPDRCHVPFTLTLTTTGEGPTDHEATLLVQESGALLIDVFGSSFDIK